MIVPLLTGAAKTIVVSMMSVKERQYWDLETLASGILGPGIFQKKNNFTVNRMKLVGKLGLEPGIISLEYLWSP